jgi:hypothetical protein
MREDATGEVTPMTNVLRNVCSLQLAIGCLALLILPGCASRAPVPAPAPTRTGATEQHFADPNAAVEAVVAACRTADKAALVTIFGEEARALLSAGDEGALHERCSRFVNAAEQMTRLDPKAPNALELVVGFDDFPFPVPLVKDEAGWRFDTKEGEQELLRRRVGADELEAIAACKSYVRAQKAYASRPREGKVKAYAQKIASTPGKRDGLYWASTGKGDESPLGPAVAAAGDYAKAKRPAGSWWGYYFRILTAQGAAAPGGARSYLKNGHMTGGFALVAYPVEYRSTGIMTFIVGKDGRIYEKDLGEKSDQLVAEMKEYNPDASWQLVSD